MSWMLLGVNTYSTGGSGECVHDVSAKPG